jgi:hypothetical protein
MGWAVKCNGWLIVILRHSSCKRTDPGNVTSSQLHDDDDGRVTVGSRIASHCSLQFADGDDVDGLDRTYRPSLTLYHDGITFHGILLAFLPILSTSHLQPESPTSHQDYSPSHSRAVSNPNRLTSWSLCRLVVKITHFLRQAPVHGKT